MKKKYLNGAHWNAVDELTSTCKHIKNGFIGHVSLVKIKKVKYKITVDYYHNNPVLFDVGYKFVMFYPIMETFVLA